jgi:tetratricopeptide (TPR) repeat protein/peptidoglycan/xylan/chitin deacetylase (PgdA/CDA1 family)
MGDPMTTPDPTRGPFGGRRDKPSRMGTSQTWLIFLAGALLLMALWTPVKGLISSRLYQPEAPKGPIDSTAFVALAYEGVSSRTNEVSPEQFDAQLKLLRENGYNPIGLKEVVDLFQAGKKLPRKAVLTTFEQSRKSSYFDTRQVLRQNRWKAVMFVWGRPIRDEDPSALRWPYIRDMILSKTWEVGGESDDGFRQVPADPSGRLGNYMSTPRWIGTEKRYETPEEFGRRIEADVKANHDELQRQTGEKPLAYAYPYGDFGQYDSRALLTRRLNLDLVGKYFDLGFLHGPMALNSIHSDPRHLNRLLVDARWTPQELLARLERSWPVRREFRDFKGTIDTAWVNEWGQFLTHGGVGILQAGPETTGAKIWLAGSDLLQNFQTRLSFRLTEGQFSCFLRAEPDGETHVTVGLDDTGRIWVRQKFSGLDDFTLATADVVLPPDRRCTLDITLRGNLCFVRLNGEMVSQTAIRLRGNPEPGMLGLSIWSPEKAKARVEIQDLVIVNQVEQVSKWRPVLNRGPYLAWWINRNADQMAYLSPPWAEVTFNGLQVHPNEDFQILRNLARVYDFAIYPCITVDSESGLDKIQPTRLVEDLKREEYDGLFLDFSPLERPTIGKVTQWIKQISDSMNGSSLRLMVRFPAVLERTTTFPTILDLMPDVRLVTSPNSPLFLDSGTITNAVISYQQVPAPAFDLDLSLYYEVTGLSETNRKYSKDVQVEMLRQLGFNAFAIGDFEESLRYWGQWLDSSTNNPEALMLIGDVHLRMQDMEKALAYYDLSLKENPGQIELALRRAALLDNMNRPEDARVSLNLYARMFPQNMDVLLAQADWLNRHERREEARALVQHAIARKPDDLKALIRYQLLADDPVERFKNMRRIKGIGTGVLHKEAFADLMMQSELLSMPESGLLMPFILETAQKDPDPRIRKRFSKMLPPEMVIEENFIEEGKVTDNWMSSSGEIPTRMGRLYLRAEGAQTEAYLRLNGSEGLRNGFIESTLEDVRGYFWLYARRGPTTMLRFGFEKSNLFMQVWKNGKLLANEVRPWRYPEQAFTLRLEVVGDGAMGYMNGKAVFDAPVTIPVDLMNGWWGISPFSPVPGQAQVVIKDLSAGPLPVFMAMPNQLALKSGDQLLDDLKEGMRTLSAICPPWFRQTIEGYIGGIPGPELDLLRMYTLYHRKRLMPMVYMGYNTKLTADWLLRTAEQYHLNGYVLVFLEMPKEAWFEEMQKQLETSSLCVLAMESTPDTIVAKVREVTILHGLFQPTRMEWPLQMRPWSDAFSNGRMIEFSKDMTNSAAILWEETPAIRQAAGLPPLAAQDQK